MLDGNFLFLGTEALGRHGPFLDGSILGAGYRVVEETALSARVSEVIRGIVAAPPAGVPLDGVRTKLAAYRALPSNWNGYGGSAPKASAVDDCLEFLGRLGPMFQAPTPMVSGQGEVGLLLEIRGGAMAEVGFLGDRRFGWMVRLADGTSDEGEGVSMDARLPQPLRDALALFAAR